MDGKELQDLVSPWPREAWPKCVESVIPLDEKYNYRFKPPKVIGYGSVVVRLGTIKPQPNNSGDSIVVLMDHAAALFVESGLRWLMRAKPITLLAFGDGENVLLEQANRVDEYRPTILHAVASAIAKVHGQKGVG